MNHRDIIFFVGEDWGRFSQRSQSLAIEMASRGHRIFYVQPILSFGAILKDLWHWKSTKSLEVPARVTLLKPLMSLVTFRGGETWRFDKWIFKFWFRRVKKAHRFDSAPVVIVNLPYWWKWAIDRTDFPAGTFIYDCIDDIKVYARNERVERDMRELEVRLVQDCDIVLTTAVALNEHISAMNITKPTKLLSNGVDTRKFAINLTSPRPKLFSDKPRPIFGFVGAIYYWIDLTVVEILAKEFPECTIILVGPTNRQEEIYLLCKKYPQVIYVGPVDYSEVPRYIASFDVCLNPFVVDRLGDSVNPLKLYEYLAMGKPVLSSSTAELRHFSHVVYLFSNYTELKTVAQLAISETGNERAKSRREFATKHSWSTKVDAILELVGG